MSLHRVVAIASLLSLASCSKAETPPPQPTTTVTAASSASAPPAVIGDTVTASSGSTAQVAVGGRREAGGNLPFDIVAVHEKVDRADAPPWWKGSGAWTFFDATTADGATMTVGLKEVRRLKGDPVTYIIVDAIIAAKDGAEGEKLVDALASALRVEVPVATGPKKPPVALKASSVVLAENAKRDSNGAFGGSDGGWTASKWTFEVPDGDTSAEIFVNYNLTAKKGELSRKSARYDPTVVKFLAASLRDGVPLAAAPAKDAGKTKP